MREAPAHRPARLTPRLMELMERSVWVPVLPDDLTFGYLGELREALALLSEQEIPEALAEARRLREEIPRTTSKAGKTQIAFDFVTPKKVLREQIAGGLLRQDLTLALSNPQAEPVVPVVDAEHEGAPAKVFSFPTSTVRFAYSKYFAPAAELAKVLPFIEAVSRFDVDALLACVDYAERSLRGDADQLVPIIAELDAILMGAAWSTEAILVNRGDRALVVHAYGALVTRGTQRSIPALPLRVSQAVPAVAPSGASSIDRAPSYVSVPPQSTLRLQFESDVEEPTVGSSALEAVFDTDLLDCSIVLLRQGRVYAGRKTLRSDWVRFGKKLDADQSRLVLEAAGKRRR
ncbi:MAG: hypothetical protein QM572_01770 [Nocardioides sp.]|uniref:hypothetical protein n=1 Tax=Nocardioides sp. TaxID=35761 RepID=UPI0039E47DD4